MTSTRVCAVAALALCGLAACGGDDDAPSSDAATPTADAATPAADAATPAVDASTVAMLVSRWSAEGDYADGIGSNDGTPGGGVDFAAGRAGNGQAFSFDGTTGVIELPVIPAMAGASVTMAAWVYTTRLNQQQAWILGQAFSTQMNISPADKLMFQFDTGQGFQITEDPELAPLNEWVHVAGTLAPVAGSDPPETEVVLYRNGQPVATNRFPGQPSDSGCPSIIGSATACGFDGQYFEGMLDELVIYDQALDAAEVEALFEASGG
jgi:hypothetical protein